MYWLLGQLQSLGSAWFIIIQNVGRSGMLLWRSLVARPQKQGIRLVIRQLYFVGVLSLVIIGVSGAFIGMVLSIQGHTLLSDYGSEQAVGQMIALTMLRELGPVVTGLLFAGRAGSAMTAEIGLMKATEQLASMEMMGVDPLRRVIAPRFWAGLISMPLLSVIFSTVGIFAGSVVAVEWLGIYAGSFWSNMQIAVDFGYDIGNCLIKSFVFGVAVTWIAVSQGYESIPTSEGISAATTKTVVYSSLTVLGLDFVLTALMFGDF